MQEYYDKYLKKPGEGLCAVCGNPTEYLSTTKGYRICCSAECSKIYKREIGKKKIEEALSIVCVSVIGLAIVGWIGFSIYTKATTAAEENASYEYYDITTEALQDYLGTLD